MTEHDLTQKKHKPSDYVAMMIWNKSMGSFQYYWENEQDKAAAAGAPVDALYERVEAGGVRTGKWVRLSDLTPEHTFRETYRLALEKR